MTAKEFGTASKTRLMVLVLWIEDGCLLGLPLDAAIHDAVGTPNTEHNSDPLTKLDCEKFGLGYRAATSANEII